MSAGGDAERRYQAEQRRLNEERNKPNPAQRVVPKTPPRAKGQP